MPIIISIFAKSLNNRQAVSTDSPTPQKLVKSNETKAIKAATNKANNPLKSRKAKDKMPLSRAFKILPAGSAWAADGKSNAPAVIKQANKITRVNGFLANLYLRLTNIFSML